MMEYTSLQLFCGIGGGALGFQQARMEFGGKVGTFRTLCGIDSDPHACQDFEYLTGAKACQMDLFSRSDYVAFHGEEPPEDWREVMPHEIYQAAGEVPDVVFLSPPCKGFSGLLGKEQANSEKYQALNRLTVRSIRLVMDAFADDLPGIILIENVPRIRTRGKELLEEIRAILVGAGYLIVQPKDEIHDCGEVGGLAQHRMRYLFMARNPKKVPNFVYQPPKKRVKALGEVVGPLWMPNDEAAGPMHRLPKLQWKTWVRLSLIPAGGDWRDLQKINPKEYRIAHIPRNSSLGVMDWENPANTITGNMRCGGSSPGAISDPREGVGGGYSNKFKICRWNETGTTVTGTADIQSGAQSINDVRDDLERYGNQYQIKRWDEPSQTVTGAAGVSNGAPLAADPRLAERNGCDRFNHQYRVNEWSEPGNTVTGATGVGTGGQIISDPRVKCNPRSDTMGVQKWGEPAKTVIGSLDVHAGAAAIGDVRIKHDSRPNLMGVANWEKPMGAVLGNISVTSGNGVGSVADPRIPDDKESGIFVIIAEDGTWHRPLTTLELAALQSFPMIVNGKPLLLAGNSDKKWRERIGNAVPVKAAKATAETMLLTLMASEQDIWLMGTTDIWVMPESEGVPCDLLWGCTESAEELTRSVG